jgi:hypothetical protein
MMPTRLQLLAILYVPILAGSGLESQTYQSQIAHPIVQYRLSAQLDPDSKIVHGHYVLTWWNHTTDSIPDLYFHLYLNAFKNLDSTFMREGSISRRRFVTEYWKAKPGQSKWGWVDVDKIQEVGGPDLTSLQTFVHPDDQNAADRTVMRIVLPKPIPPHGTIQLAVDFTSKLPRALARTGYEGHYFLVAQWFPKIAVYEAAGERGRRQGGWNCHQFHANTEFYADYGVYDVDLTVPSKYVVGATGFLRSQQQRPNGLATYNFYQQDVHDFAWTASPLFLKITRTFRWRREVMPEEVVHWARVFNLPSAEEGLRDVSVTLLLQPDHKAIENRYFRAIFNGLKYFGLWYGAYPYDTLTVVDPPRNSHTGGMEYPTFISAGAYFWPGKHQLSPEGVTIHEFGHQFWYGLVGNNEFEEAWLDEGFNTYSTGKVLEAAYGGGCQYQRFWGIPVAITPWVRVSLPEFPFAGVGGLPLGAYFNCLRVPERTAGRGFYLEHAKDDNLVRNGWEYLDGASYVVNSYTRTGLTLRTLESYLGPDVMARIMRAYQLRWRYRHPSTQDFIDVVNQVSGQNMDWFFAQFFYNSNITDYAVARATSHAILGKVGVYGEGSNKTTYSEQQARAAFRKNPHKMYRTTVVVRRRGEAVAPVDVKVRFTDGETAVEHWDGQYRWVKYDYEKAAQVSSAEVDPEHKLALDANFTNNSYVAAENNRGAEKWYVRWIFWLENLFFAAGFFS